MRNAHAAAVQPLLPEIGLVQSRCLHHHRRVKPPCLRVCIYHAGPERAKRGCVTMGHVDAAVTEMFRAVHMQLLGNTCRLEKLLLAALVMETRATGAQLWQFT